MPLSPYSRWHGGATGRALDLRSTGRGFKSYSGQKLRNNLGQVVHTYVPVPKHYNLVPAKDRWCSVAGKVTAGLAESNGSLPPGGWLIVTCGWLPVHRDQLRAQCSVTVWEAFTFFTTLVSVKPLCFKAAHLPCSSIRPDRSCCPYWWPD